VKETLVVIVGAGASVRAGISSTADLTRRVKDALPVIEVPGVVAGPRGGVARLPSSRFPSMADILDQGLRSDYGSDYDYERILHALEELEPFLGARYNPDGSPLADTPVLGSFAELMRRFECIDDESVIRTARLEMLKLVHRIVGGDCDYPTEPHTATPAREQLGRLFAVLVQRYRLVAITFNYDDLLDRMPLQWQDGFTIPVSDKFCWLFSPDAWSGFVEDESANLLIHLHGSVRYGHRPQETHTTIFTRFAEPARYDYLTAAQDSVADSATSGTSADGAVADASYIVSGLRKASKLAYNARPYGYYYRSVMDFLPKARRLLVLGYGWRDAHVNTWVNEYGALRGDHRTAVVTRRLGEHVDKLQLPENRMLAMLAGPSAWAKMRTFAHLRHEYEKDWPSPFSIQDNFALAPEGFVMSSEDEAKLLEFIMV
jgi:hypothetical protein